jgi:hypothetical protein
MPKSLIAAIVLLVVGGLLWWATESRGADLPIGLNAAETAYVQSCARWRVDHGLPVEEPARGEDGEVIYYDGSPIMVIDCSVMEVGRGRDSR